MTGAFEKKSKKPGGFEDNLAYSRTAELVYLRKQFEFLEESSRKIHLL